MALFQFLKSWHQLSSWKKILISLILGAATGLLLGPRADLFKPIGNLFINAIHMMVTPVVFTAIVCAVLSVTDAKKMRNVTIQAAFIYVASMAVAATIGISIATLIAPGMHFHPMLAHTHTIVKAPTFSQLFENLIPRSPIGAFAHEYILQIVVFALFLGVEMHTWRN